MVFSECANYAAAQQINPAAPFVLSWDAFAGAGGQDRIEISIRDQSAQTIFQAPDECANPPITLANSATSVTLAANLLQCGSMYDVELRFSRFSDFKTNAAPQYVGVAGFAKSTHFILQTTGGGTPVITAVRIAPDGKLETDVQGPIGAVVSLEASDAFSGWLPVANGVVPAGGVVTLEDSRLVIPSPQFYRARTP